MKNQDGLISSATRSRLEVQGYKGFTDRELLDFRFGIRFAYYSCGALVLTGLALSNVIILTVALAVAFFGTLPPYHPFDYLYNYGVRRLLNKPKIPPRSNQGRFACGIATVWLAGVILLMNAELYVWAYLAGGILLCIAALVSMTDICIPSIMYNFLFKRRAYPAEV